MNLEQLPHAESDAHTQPSHFGETVTIVDMEWPKNDGFGLDLVVERNGQPHRIEARSVELLKPFPEGHLFLAAYLAWKKYV